MSARIAVVAKDLMAARGTTAVAEGLAALGCHLTAFLEGKALTEFSAPVAERIAIGPEQDPENTELPLAAVREMLRAARPDVVLVGTSAPVHAERTFALAANDACIPVAAYPDTWGAENRLGKDVLVTLWFAIDKEHAAIALARGRTLVIGDPAYATIARPIPPEALERLSAYGDPARMILLVGEQHRYIRDLADAAVALAGANPEYALVAKLWHPKLPPVPELAAAVDAKLGVLGDRLLRLSSEDAALLSTDRLAGICDATVGTFSTVLRVAAAAGKRCISVHTPASILGMLEATGLTFFPLAVPDGPVTRWNYEAGGSGLPLVSVPYAAYAPKPPDARRAAEEILALAS